MGGADIGGLRPLDWAELVARLNAARDMRAVLGRPRLGGGSFAPLSAAVLAHSYGERGVNLDALACGKRHEGMNAETALVAAIGDRDN